MGIEEIAVPTEDTNRDAEMKTISDFVSWYRDKEGITPKLGSRFEFSCEAHGEGWTILYIQLVPTTTSTGPYWKEVREDPVIRKLVLTEIDLYEISGGRSHA